MHKDDITELALAHGFKLKTQPDGTEALNPYVFDFVRAINASHDALLSAKCAEIAALRQAIETAIVRFEFLERNRQTEIVCPAVGAKELREALGTAMTQVVQA